MNVHEAEASEPRTSGDKLYGPASHFAEFHDVVRGRAGCVHAEHGFAMTWASEGATKAPCITTGIGTLDFARLRQDDPTLGRWHFSMRADARGQPDPLGFVDGPSVYGYAVGSPGMAVDPDGRWVWIPIGIGSGLGVEALADYVERKNCSCQSSSLPNYVASSLNRVGAGVAR